MKAFSHLKIDIKNLVKCRESKKKKSGSTYVILWMTQRARKILLYNIFLDR